MNRGFRAGAAILISVVVASCGSAAPSVDFIGPCVVDGRAAGAYPQLEEDLPRRSRQVEDTLVEIPPTTLDSGRNCTTEALGTLAAHGVTELRFAGATWDEGGGNAIARALLTRPDGPLPAQWVEEFYESSARADRRTENIQTSRPALGSEESVFRLDTLNGLSLQTVVVWPEEYGILVVIVATTVEPNASRAEHDRRVEAVAGGS